jgi:FKBP-type peptidyl-prolyl cis-trans isomerase FkpA
MKFTLPLLVFSILITGCAKKDPTCGYTDSIVVAPSSEMASLQDSLTAHGITATQHPSGIYYKINAAGGGQSVANLCTSVTVTYKGMFFNGKVFDSTGMNRTATFQLGEVIVGWQKGIPLVSSGGRIDLYIPPALGYGSSPIKDNYGNVVVPGNSYLIFNVHVTDIQ